MKKCISLRLKFLLTICTLYFNAQCMPQKSIRKVSFQDVPERIRFSASPNHKNIVLTNHYKLLCDDLANKDFETFIKNFQNYLDQIPYDIKINNKNFYRTLFYTIACYINHKNTCIFSSEDSFCLPIKKEDGTLFILEFIIVDTGNNEESSSDLLYRPTRFVLLSKTHSQHMQPINILQIKINLSKIENIEYIATYNNNAKVTRYLAEEDFEFPTYHRDNNLRKMLDVFENLKTLNDEILIKKNMNTICEYFNNFYKNIPKKWHINKERYYQGIFFCIMTFIRSKAIEEEVKTSIGRSDIVITTPDTIIVFEFKFKSTPQKALSQIENKDYPALYNQQKLPIWMIGLNIDKNLKTTIEYDLYQSKTPTLKIEDMKIK